MNVSFRPDTNVERTAKAYSLDAVDIAFRNFAVKLDWSDESIRRVEEILSQLHDSLAASKPDEETIWAFAKSFGSYVGEVFRRHHGGTWGMVKMAEHEFPGIQAQEDHMFWPWSRAHKRIINGPEDNIWHYYQTLLS